MIKKRFISSILLCAFTVLFAHSIIPHHHHEEEATAQHQASHDDHHEDIDHNFLERAFSHLQHDQGGSIVYETASPDFKCPNVNFDKDTILLVQHIIGVLHKPPLIHTEPSAFHFTSSSYSVTTLLRGPPVLVA